MRHALVFAAFTALGLVVTDTWLQYRAQSAALAAWDFLESSKRAGFNAPFWLTPDPWGLK